MSVPVLVTIPYSHYCERARWALQRAGVVFREEPHLPIFHYAFTLGRGVGRTVPALMVDRENVGDSQAILHWANARMPEHLRIYPERSDSDLEHHRVPRFARHAGTSLGPVLPGPASLEPWIDMHLGPHSRRWVYKWALPDRTRFVRFLSPKSALQRAALNVAHPFMLAYGHRLMDISDAAVTESRAEIDRVFERVEDILQDGRRYLTGDRFTAVDLTFASLCSPLVIPAEYGVELPAVETLAEQMQAEVLAYRAHPAGQYALRIYREERRASASADHQAPERGHR